MIAGDLMSTYIGQTQRRVLTAAAIISLVGLCAVGCGGSASPSTAAATTHSAVASTAPSAGPFPNTLLGLPKDNSSSAHQLASAMVTPIAASGFLVHPQAAVYDGPNNGLVVALGELSSSAMKYGNPGNASAAGLRKGFLIMGLTDVQTFPPGDSQARMVCGKITRNGLAAILCERVSKTGTVGMTIFFNGLASGVSDAASKTSHILSVVGG